MSVTLTVELPASEFDIGRVVEAVNGVEIDLTMVVPLDDRLMPFLEVHDDDHESFAERLEAHPAVDSIIIVERSDSEGTYAVEWTEDPNPFCRALSDHTGTILRAVRDGDRWEFDLLFLSEEALKAFRERLDEVGIRLEVRRISRSTRPVSDPQEGLSDAQRETLNLAISQGYYSVPRETTTAELAEQLDVSDQAVVERLRRAMRRLGKEYLAAGRGRGRP